MAARLTTILERQRVERCPDLAGSTLRIRASVRDEAVNAWIASARLPSAIESAHVVFGDGLRLAVRGAVRVFGFRKRVEVPLLLASRADLSRGIVVQAAFDGASLLSTAASWVRPFLGTLPAGVSLVERGVTIDLQQGLAARGLGDLRGYLRDVEFATSGGRLSVGIELAVPSREPVRMPAPTEPEGGSGTLAPEASPSRPGLLTLVDEIEAELRLRVTDVLVTAVVQALLELARAPREPRRHAWPSFEWVRAPEVAFETGTATITAALVVHPSAQHRSELPPDAM